MTFKASDLSVLACANNFTLWHYVTTDKLSTLIEDNYFNKVSDMLRPNDLLMVNADIDGEPETKFIVVTGNDLRNVKVKTY